MKDKEWLKEELMGLNFSINEFGKIRLGEVFKLVDQLDEPETLSQGWIDENKVARIDNLRKMTTSDVVPVENLKNLLVPKHELSVIPKFVADWIESRDYYNVYKVLQDLSAPGSPHAPKEVRNWIFHNQENVEKFVRAWLDGYEVEKEKKYRVVFNSQTDDLILFQTGKHLFIGAESANDGYWKQHFTEAEIKAIDKRYWAFAEEVQG